MGVGSAAGRRQACTTLFQRLIRPVPAVPLSITHFPAVHALATYTEIYDLMLTLSGRTREWTAPVTLGRWVGWGWACGR